MLTSTNHAVLSNELKSTQPCGICKQEGHHKVFKVKEMMLGLRDEFHYQQCSNCGCLQLLDPPQDMSLYYPTDYYSFSQKASGNFLKKWLKNLKNSYALGYNNLIGKILFQLRPNSTMQMLAALKIEKSTKVLDIGCGAGHLLFDLKDWGCEHLLGVDAFIEKDILYENGLQIQKKEVDEIQGEWDVIMMHHAFEHMSEPEKVLQQIKKLLAPNGTILIRVPVSDSQAWLQYAENWVQIDAPRHFYVFTQKAIATLANRCNMEVYHCVFDSTAFQFWGSEQYLQNISLHDQHSYAIDPQNSMFSKKQIISFNQQAQELNASKQGDCCGFFLRIKQ